MLNNNKIKLLIPVLILVLVFLFKTTIVDLAEKRLKVIVNFVPFETIVDMTKLNEQSIEILKNGNFAFDRERVLLGTEPAKLAKYFQTVGKMDSVKILDANKNTGNKKDNKKQPNTKKVLVKKITGQPVYDINSVYLGKNMNYIMLDGLLLKTGDVTPKGEKIIDITKTKIEVSGKWGKRWITVN